jgi:hypothetical protein
MDNHIPQLAPNHIEVVTFWVSVVTLIGTAWVKLDRGQGMFLFNPCHITLLMMIILLKTNNTSSTFMKRMHTAWSALVFGAFAALLIPHLEGVSTP